MFDIDLSMVEVVLALQELPRDIPGEATPQTGDGAIGDGRPRGDQANPMTFIWILLFAFMLIILMSWMGNRRERKKREEMIASIKKHDKVQTIGGVIGSIVELKPDFVVLKVDESSNTRITFARSAIQQVLKSSSAGSKEKEQEKVIEPPSE